jgi:hypothetical protein
MIPLLMRLDISKPARRGVALYFPVIILWIVAFALLAVALPFVLVATLVTLHRGPGLRLLAFYPVFCATVFSLSGLRVDIASHRSRRLFISFD